MAKKKKQTKKRSTKQVAELEPREPSQAVGYVLAVICILTAVFLVLGGFNTGGSLPTGLFDAMAWVLGWAAWLLPITLVYWGFYKFTNEDHRVPKGRVFSMYAFLALAAAWCYTAFSDKSATGSITGGNGGHVGNAIGEAVLGALDKVPASLLFFLFGLLAFFFAFGISPSVLLKLRDMFKRPEPEESELAELKAKAAEKGFQLNEGVPVMRHSDSPTKEQARYHLLLESPHYYQNC